MSAEPSPRPLSGRRVLLGRARPGPSALAAELRLLGAEVIEAPSIALAPAESPLLLTAALSRRDAFDGIVLACAAGAEAALREAPRPLAPILAVGNEAAAALSRGGVEPAVHVRATCEEALGEHEASLRGKRLLLVTSDDGRPSLLAALADLGAEVEAVSAYRVVRAMPPLDDGPVDIVVLPSSSAAHAIFGSALGPHLIDVPVAAMGPLTAAAAEQHGARRVTLAAQDTVPALVACAVALAVLRSRR